MRHNQDGATAEAVVAGILKHRGYKIISRNWRRPRGEVDIVAQKRRVIYFIEVKYRATASYGSGLEYITPTKLKQMDFAARLWCAENSWEGDWCLLAAAVSGPKFSVSLVEI